MAGRVDLPVVDLASPDVRASTAAVRQVCVEHGFFYVSNHGVESALLEAVFAESRRFFEQPMEGKMALRRGSSHRGYTPPYAEKLDAASQFEGDLKESFYIGPDLNQWPPEEFFPSWKDTMKLYKSTALAVGKKILSLIALSLDLDAEFFQKIGALNCPSALVRLLHYPGEVNESDSGNYGASAHSDYGMITLLVTDGTPGLQICREKDRHPQLWEDVPHIDGTLIVNIGDLLERWMNCLFRIADGDETPAAPEIMAAMDVAKATIKESLKTKPRLLAEVLECFEKRWENQMEQTIYGAALYLNPGKFFALREKDRRQAARLRSMFNDVLWKMVNDDDEQSKISKQADDYERSEGECFSKPGAIRDRDRKNPILWWGAYGGLAYELQSLAKRIVSLCCSASGCERNWSEFAHIHTKKRNKLEHQRLNKLVYVSYNRKMENRFAAIRELGSKGKRSNPLVLEEFLWENEWVEESNEGEGDNLWSAVDEVVGATQGLRGRNLPRIAAAAAATSSQPHRTYVRTRKRPRNAAAEDIGEEDESDHQDDVYPVVDTSLQAEVMDEEGSESGGRTVAADGDAFELHEDLLL